MACVSIFFQNGTVIITSNTCVSKFKESKIFIFPILEVRLLSCSNLSFLMFYLYFFMIESLIWLASIEEKVWFLVVTRARFIGCYASAVLGCHASADLECEVLSQSDSTVPAVTWVWFSVKTIFFRCFFQETTISSFYAFGWRKFFISQTVRELAWSCDDVFFKYFARKVFLFWHWLFKLYFSHPFFFFLFPSILSWSNAWSMCIILKFRLHFHHQHTLITYPTFFHQIEISFALIQKAWMSLAKKALSDIFQCIKM